MEKKMLIIEEDQQTGLQMQQFFSQYYRVDCINNGLEGLVRTIESKPDVVILNHTLQNVSSLEVCRHIRQNANSCIIIIGKPLGEDQIISFYESGIDDFIPQPLSLRVVHCKVRVHLNRLTDSSTSEAHEKEMIKFGSLVMDKTTHKVFCDNKELNLTRKEFAILWMLAKKKEAVVTRSELLRVVWHYEHLDDDRLIDTHLNRIRKKLKQHQLNVTIKTVWGIGYKLHIEEPITSDLTSVN